MLKAALASRWSFEPQVKQVYRLPLGRWMLPHREQVWLV
jgi:hypothetical protein